MSKQYHFVVVFDDEENTFSVDDDTLYAKFRDGTVYTEERGWEFEDENGIGGQISETLSNLISSSASDNSNKDDILRRVMNFLPDSDWDGWDDSWSARQAEDIISSIEKLLGENRPVDED